MATQADMVMAIRADVGALRKDMKQMENTVHRSSLNMSAAFGKVFKLANLATVGGSILALGRTMTNAIQAPIQEYIEFDDTMRMVAQRSQATAGDLMVLRDTAMDLGRRTSFTAQQVAGAMRNMATATRCIRHGSYYGRDYACFQQQYADCREDGDRLC